VESLADAVGLRASGFGSGVVDVLDGQISGNFMIRGFGSNFAPVPTLSAWGILVFVALVAIAGVCFARLRTG